MPVKNRHHAQFFYGVVVFGSAIGYPGYMAVYTQLSSETIGQLLEEHYAVGAFDFALGIAQGVENTNYLVVTQREGREEKYILTLYEKRVKREDLPFFMELMVELHGKGVVCPVPILRRDRTFIGEVEGKPAAMVSFLHGKSLARPAAQHVASLGGVVARMHVATEGFTLKRENALSLAGWQAIAAKVKGALDGIAPGLEALVEEEIAYLAMRWPTALPRGVVHADIFPDNVFFEGDDVSGVIDFYFACEDMYAYDLAIVMNAWCFEPSREFNLTKAKRLFAEYQAVRGLSAQEREALPVLARGAALRFLLTRAHDWLFTEKSALVVPHDPVEYMKKLQFHRQVGGAGEYGI